MMPMDWLIVNSAHRNTIRRDKSPTPPKSNINNKDKKQGKQIEKVLRIGAQYSKYPLLLSEIFIMKKISFDFLKYLNKVGKYIGWQEIIFKRFFKVF